MKQSIVYELERGNLLTLTGMRGRELRVESGQVWLTEEAQPHDNVLFSSQTYRARSGQHLVIEALAATRLSVPEDAGVSDVHLGLRGAWALAHAVLAGLRNRGARLQLGRAA